MVQEKRLQSKTIPEQLAAMSGNIEKLNSKIERAVADGQLIESAAEEYSHAAGRSAVGPLFPRGRGTHRLQ